MSALPPNLPLVPLALLLAAASTACAPGPVTDTATATHTPQVSEAAVAQPAAATAGDAHADPDACDVARVDALAGHAATPSNLDLARELSGAGSIRVIHPGDAVTEDYSASRLNLEVDENDVILRAACG